MFVFPFKKSPTKKYKICSLCNNVIESETTCYVINPCY